MSVFNRCIETGNVLLILECWQDVHPALVSIPVKWEYSSPYGLLYALNPPDDVMQFETMVPDTINILSGILAEMGDISRFDDVKEIQKLSGLGLVACSSGKHKGETKISHRGRKRLRYWLFQAAKSAVAHAEEVKELHVYYTTRPDNPLKKMQSLIVIACKLLRIVYTILKKGTVYDPKKMLMDIRRPEKKEAIAA